MKEENYYYGGRHVMAKTKAYKSFSFSIFLFFTFYSLLLASTLFSSVYFLCTKKSHVFSQLERKRHCLMPLVKLLVKLVAKKKPKKRRSQYQLQRQQTTKRKYTRSQMFNVSYEIAVKIIIFIIIITNTITIASVIVVSCKYFF